MIPLYAFLEGDTVGLLLLAYPEDTVEQLQTKLLSMARTRVAPNGSYTVHFSGKPLENAETVAAIGLTALDRIDVRRKDGTK